MKSMYSIGTRVDKNGCPRVFEHTIQKKTQIISHQTMKDLK
jgi:hypothetical protein